MSAPQGQRTACHVVVEREPAAGAWNMALDEALLNAAVESGRLSLRLYRWDQATLSLGYFQKVDQIPQRLRDLPVVRRLSGGGALLHHHEWTYACVVPPAHPLVQDPLRLYETVHEPICEVLAGFGIVCRMRGARLEDREAEFLCFGRGDPRDLLCESHKVLGSAQRRRRGAVLQHGSLLLQASPLSDGVPGISDLSDCSPETFNVAFAGELARAIAGRLGEPLVEADHPREIHFAADRLQARYRLA